MKKLFVSADLEGTTGITHWGETEIGGYLYDRFTAQMTREVAAACEGAISQGFDDILVKDAHDSGRNIDPAKLPEQARIFRAWSRHPYSMMFGLDDTFEGVVFTGYHNAAGTNSNPLSHTMNRQNNFVKINGVIASELMMNSLTAAYIGVPVYCVCGDKGLCDWIQSVNPNIEVVPVSEGTGNGSMSIHPDVAVRRIRETVAKAVQKAGKDCMFPLPEHFHVEINFREHYRAYDGGFYPGATQLDEKTVAFDADDWMDCLKFFHWVL